jgi:hypothetical protein
MTLEPTKRITSVPTSSHLGPRDFLVPPGAVVTACIEFLAIPILSVLIFAVFVIAEMWNGRRTDLMSVRK